MDRVRVLCRVRPPTADETARGAAVVRVSGQRVELVGAAEFLGEHETSYAFDAVRKRRRTNPRARPGLAAT